MADDRRPTKIACTHCGREVAVNARGRTPLFCGPSCRSMHFVQKNRTGTKVSAEERQRLMLWQMLVDLKVITADTPMPPPKPKPGDAS